MAHSRARKRKKARELKAKLEGEERPDDCFYDGTDCSCGDRLYYWLVPHQRGKEPARVRWPFVISAEQNRGCQAVIAATAVDARKILAGQKTQHDTHIESRIVDGGWEPHPAHAI